MTTARRSCSGFTLIELLVVIAIIGILASILLPTVSRLRTKAQIRDAQREMALLAAAISAYEAQYGRFPVSPLAAGRAAASKGDFTYGGALLSASLGAGDWISDNNEVIAMIMDLEAYRDGTPTLNKGHVKNPSRTRFLEAESASDSVSHGIGLDGVYRDPWGTPYIITLDLNNDGNCRDAFYGRQRVSQTQTDSPTGFNGLSNAIDLNGNGDHFESHGTIMIWSAGPDRAIDPNKRANEASNKDNVRSW